MAWNPDSGALPDPWAALSGADVVAPDMTANITDNINAVRNAVWAGWTSYTPVLTGTSSPTLGTGAVALGRYKIIGGNHCTFVAGWVWGTTPTAGSGAYFMSLPVNWQNDSLPPQFTASYTIPGTSTTMFIATPATASTLAFNRGDATANQLGAAYPSAPAVNRSIYVTGSYRCGA